MTNFTKDTEQYIEHEVQLRLHSEIFNQNDKRYQEKFLSIDKSMDRLDSTIKHLDNKFMLMFSIVLGSIWLPAILHYLHIA